MVSSDVSSSTGRELSFEHTSVSEEGSEIHRWSVGRVECSETIEVTMIESEDPTSTQKIQALSARNLEKKQK